MLFKRGGRDMKRVINLIKNDDSIEIVISEDKIIKIGLDKNELNIKTLYKTLNPVSGDEFFFADSISKEEKPKTDISRLFNNLYDFLEELFTELNTILVSTEETEKEH